MRLLGTVLFVRFLICLGLSDGVSVSVATAYGFSSCFVDAVSVRKTKDLVCLFETVEIDVGCNFDSSRYLNVDLLVFTLYENHFLVL